MRSLFLVLILILSLIPMGASGALGDASSNPIDIVEGLTTGTLPGPAGDGSIWYQISLISSDSYQFELSTSGANDFDLYLYDSSVSLINSNTSADQNKIIVEPSLSGSILINIVPSSGTGTFDLQINNVANSFSTAVDLSFGSYRLDHSSIDSDIDEHFYNFTLDQEINLYFGGKLDDTSSELGFFLYNTGGTILTSGTDMTNDTLAAGRYTLRIFHSIGAGLFWLNLTGYGFEPWAAMDYDGSVYNGDFTGQTSSLWFSAYAFQGYEKITLDSATSDFDLILHEGSEQQDTGSDLTKSLVLATKQSSKSVLIQVRSNGNTGSFDLKMETLGYSTGSPVMISEGEYIGSHPLAAGQYWYQITPQVMTAYNFTVFTNETGFFGYTIDLYNSTLNRIQTSSNNGQAEQILSSSLKGIHYIRIEGDVDTLFYLNVSLIGKDIKSPIISDGTLLGEFSTGTSSLWFSVTIEADRIYGLSYRSGSPDLLDIEFYNAFQDNIKVETGMTIGETTTVNQTEVSYIRVSSIFYGEFELILAEYGSSVDLPIILTNSTEVQVDFPLLNSYQGGWFRINIDNPSTVTINLDFDVYSTFYTGILYTNMTYLDIINHDHDLSVTVNVSETIYVTLLTQVSLSVRINTTIIETGGASEDNLHDNPNDLNDSSNSDSPEEHDTSDPDSDVSEPSASPLSFNQSFVFMVVLLASYIPFRRIRSKSKEYCYQ